MPDVKNRKPTLPAELYRREPAWVVACFAYAFFLYFGCGYACYAIAHSGWPMWGRLPSLVVAALLAGNGLHLLAWLAHEGVHLSMVKGKTLNLLLGGFAGSVLLFPTVGFGISHWPHHRFTNDSRDPDTALQSRQRTFLRRLLLARLAANRQYFRDGIAVMVGRPRARSWRMPFAERQLQLLTTFNFVCIALWLGLYVAVGAHDLSYALYAFGLPALLLIPVTGLRIYVEHAGTMPGDFVDARSYTSWFYTVLLFGNNYHLEHHLYPSVPSYKLHRVHKKLAAEGYYERFNSPVVGGVLGPLRFTRAAHAYPDAGLRAATTPADVQQSESLDEQSSTV